MEGSIENPPLPAEEIDLREADLIDKGLVGSEARSRLAEIPWTWIWKISIGTGLRFLSGPTEK